MRSQRFAVIGPIAILWLASSLPLALSQPATLAFTDCFSDNNTTQKLQISTVYAQVLPGSNLNLTVIGNAPVQIVSESNDTVNVATTLFTTSNILTFTVWNNHSYFCSTLRPQSPLPLPQPGAIGYCPLQPGPFAFVSSINLGSSYELATFDSRLRALDPYTTELFCIDVLTTALKPNSAHSVYGNAVIIFWTTIGLAIAYWLLVGVARIVSAWGRGLDRSTPGLWRRVHSAGFIFASALSGEKLANSPALLRFCTPSLRDIIFHSQWCAALSMIAIRWPQFVYPLLSQTAWSMLSYNATITQSHSSGLPRWNPLSVLPYNPPSNFAAQLSDPNSPLFIDQTVSNAIFTLPLGVTTGIPAFAAAVGLHPADLFGITLTLFLGICGAAMLLSFIAWLIDQVATVLRGSLGSSGSASAMGTRSPRFGSANKDLAINGAQSPQPPEENRSINSHLLLRSTRLLTPSRWRWRTGFSSFHGSVLQGNLIRVLVLFHFPVTVFSCYQMTVGRSKASVSSIILAALSFACFSVIVPVILVFRLYVTNTSKLYDETWTLLALGPLYNHYRHGSQLFACLLFATNLAFGVTIGCGQNSGTAQVIIILVIEIISALGTSFWLPWGQGASMGLISFLFCVARIVIAVLMVILTPIVGIATGAGQWVTYAILVILALVYLAFFLMLLVKLVESLVRILGGVGFHKSRHVVDSGLLGAIGLAGCCGSRKKQPSRRTRENVEAHRAATSQLSFNPAFMQKPQMATPTTSNSNPPSVLRPEHAFQPYREESDDEDGFIMGAWHSFSRPAYATIDDQTTLDPPKSGFMRVGGGRSHFDTPYAIQSGSTATFPSMGRQSTSTSDPRRVSSPPPMPSTIDAVRHNLPPGAMRGAHTRTKSQTAVIEDPSNSAVATDVSNNRANPPPDRRNSDDEMSVELSQPKKKPWYQILRHRPSDGNISIDENPEPVSDPTPGRSFVVVRKGQQSSSTPIASGSGLDDTEQPNSKKSFVVLRE